MNNYFSKWLRRQARYFAATLIPAALIVAFGMLAVTLWPAWAWGSTVAFSAVIIGVTFWLI